MSKNTERPRFYFCGICNSHHPVGFGGDCRDDSQRFALDDLDARYGTEGWEEVEQPVGQSPAEQARIASKFPLLDDDGNEMSEEDRATDEAIKKCEAYAKAHPDVWPAIWSIHEHLDFDAVAFHGPVEVAYRTRYNIERKDVCVVSQPLREPTWGDLWRAGAHLIRQSGDTYHVFIESFEDVRKKENGTTVLKMYCGS